MGGSEFLLWSSVNTCRKILHLPNKTIKKNVCKVFNGYRSVLAKRSNNFGRLDCCGTSGLLFWSSVNPFRKILHSPNKIIKKRVQCI